MQKVEERSECEHTLEKREIKGIQSKVEISLDSLFIERYMCLEFHKRTINYVGAMHSIFYYSSFIKRIANSTTKCLDRNMLRNDAVSLFGRHKKCSTRQTITLIDGCTAVNYVTNNVFQRRLSFRRFNNRLNIKVFCWKIQLIYWRNLSLATILR